MIAAHPAAKLFPLLEGDELQALADDIHDRGLLHPGVVFDGLLLDGRNRQSACEIAGVAFATERLRSCESPTAYVLSANLKRRHLSATQRAVLGAESVEHFEREAKERQRVGGRAAGRGRPIASLQTARKLSKALGESTTRAAKAAGAGTRNTAVMVAIRKKAPDVFAAVKAGSLPKVAEARAIAALPSDQRADVLARVERDRRRHERRASHDASALRGHHHHGPAVLARVPARLRAALPARCPCAPPWRLVPRSRRSVLPAGRPRRARQTPHVSLDRGVPDARRSGRADLAAARQHVLEAAALVRARRVRRPMGRRRDQERAERQRQAVSRMGPERDRDGRYRRAVHQAGRDDSRPVLRRWHDRRGGARGRRFIGVELDEQHANVAISRLAEAG